LKTHLNWPAFEVELADWTRLAAQVDVLVARGDFGRLVRHLDVLHARLTMQRAVDARATSAELEQLALGLLGRSAALREVARTRVVPAETPRLLHVLERGAGRSVARGGDPARWCAAFIRHPAQVPHA
jgi:hypothetical protein